MHDTHAPPSGEHGDTRACGAPAGHLRLPITAITGEVRDGVRLAPSSSARVLCSAGDTIYPNIDHFAEGAVTVGSASGSEILSGTLSGIIANIPGGAPVHEGAVTLGSASGSEISSGTLRGEHS